MREILAALLEHLHGRFRHDITIDDELVLAIAVRDTGDDAVLEANFFHALIGAKIENPGLDLDFDRGTVDDASMSACKARDSRVRNLVVNLRRLAAVGAHLFARDALFDDFIAAHHAFCKA